MKKELENKILKYLKEEYDNKIEIFTHYRDFDNLEDLLKNIECINDFENMIIETYEEAYFLYTNELIKETIDYLDIEDLSEDLEAEINDLIIENIEVIYPIKDFLDHYIKIDVLCDFYDEANYDFTTNGWIRWLVNSQGYKMKDLKDENNENGFLKSVRSELYNTTSHMNALTFLLEVSVRDYLKMKEGNYKSLKIENDIMCGMFDTWYGSGSDLSIELEKDIIINKKNINRVLIETTGKQAWSYTVNNVYGLIDSCWRDSYKLMEARK